MSKESARTYWNSLSKIERYKILRPMQEAGELVSKEYHYLNTPGRKRVIEAFRQRNRGRGRRS